MSKEPHRQCPIPPKGNLLINHLLGDRAFLVQLTQSISDDSTGISITDMTALILYLVVANSFAIVTRDTNSCDICDGFSGECACRVRADKGGKCTKKIAPNQLMMVNEGGFHGFSAF